MMRPLRILLVEDDPEDVLLFRKRCASRHHVHHFDSTAASLAALRNGGLDICFVDYQLPPDNGLSLVRAARAEGIRTPIVVITGQDIEAIGENALLAGATDFLPKDDLDAATIERVCRWALIRRHVESRREDKVSEQLIAQLMGRPPAVAGAATALAKAGCDAAVRRVLYLSRASRTMSSQDLLPMCASFATSNARLNITGALIYAGGRFMQVIEGESTAVGTLLAKIERDPRHGEMAVILDEADGSRLFGRWSMGLLEIPDASELSFEHWGNIQQQVRSALARGDAARDSIASVIRMLPNLLRSASVAVPPGADAATEFGS